MTSVYHFHGVLCRALLHAGSYALSYRIFNWNQPEFTPVTIVIERPDGQQVASKIYTPTKNIGGNTANAFSSGRTQKFEFDINQTGYYVIVFYTDATKNADFVAGKLTLKLKESHTSGIMDVRENKEEIKGGVYDLQGRRIKDFGIPNSELKKGLYIVNGKKVIIK